VLEIREKGQLYGPKEENSKKYSSGKAVAPNRSICSAEGSGIKEIDKGKGGKKTLRRRQFSTGESGIIIN